MPVPEHCNQSMMSIEVPGVYDGTCYWECLKCGAWKHRFSETNRLRTVLLALLSHSGHPLDPLKEIV